MNNEIKRLNRSVRADGVKEFESAVFPTLRSGLGVPNGSYAFGQLIRKRSHRTKAITTAKGKFGLTLVAGALKGNADNSSVNMVAFPLLRQD